MLIRRYPNEIYILLNLLFEVEVAIKLVIKHKSAFQPGSRSERGKRRALALNMKLKFPILINSRWDRLVENAVHIYIRTHVYISYIERSARKRIFYILVCFTL